MTTQTNRPSGVHLVGSVPLLSAEEVFTTASNALGRRLRRIPDGETGERLNWIGWQIGVFQGNPQFEIVPPEPGAYAGHTRVKLRPGVKPAEINLGPLGYADQAKVSYQEFSRLEREGILPGEVRFQVSLPTPLATITAFIVDADQAAVAPAYEAAMLEEVDQIVSSIPGSQLSIQWDVAMEVALWEGLRNTFLVDIKTGLLEQLVRLGSSVPPGVELGYHLCYGDAGHRHFKEPEDTSNLVNIANTVAAGSGRSINWLHLPVPKDRSDDAYFAPLANLNLHPETELYLGLVHLTDGVAGTQRRIQAARNVVSNFGVATECGFGRRPPESIPELLAIHAEVASPVA